MSDIRSDKILKAIKTAYFQQFDHPLTDKLLISAIEQELQKKRETFLQLQLASSGLNFTQMAELKARLQGEQPSSAAAAALEPQASAAEGLAKRAAAELAEEAEQERASLELGEFDDDEAGRRERRRAYARAYYHKKKAQREVSTSKPAKKFKTTPEQRAYQRAYYQRKKSEKVSYDKGVLAKVAAKALEAQKQVLTQQESHSSSAQSTRPDYESMTADRLAIENAFRPHHHEEAVTSSDNKSTSARAGASAEASGLSLAAPKTKLRKAVKTGSLTT